jgi:small basic protein
MMGWIPLLAGIVGFVAVYYSSVTVSPEYGAYLSIAALAGLDSVVGGVRATQAGKFKRRIFISGFLTAVILAVLLTWFGEAIGVQIFLAVGFVFVYRIMQNAAIIRYNMLDGENPEMHWQFGRRKSTGAEPAEPKELLRDNAPAPEQSRV